jgi:hypothetical protein
MDTVVIKSGGKLYRIPRPPFEPLAHTCERGWFLVEELKREREQEPMASPEVRLQASFQWLYEKQGMTYQK